MSAILLSAADIDRMSDTELYNTLKSFGLNVGPIVASTRDIYKKKLMEKIKSQDKSTSPVPGLISTNRDDAMYRHDIQNYAADRMSRSSVERPDSSNRYGDLNMQPKLFDRKSFSNLSSASTTAAYDSQDADEFELGEEEERYERHSPPAQSPTSYSRQSYGTYIAGTSGVGQPRYSDYGRHVEERLHSDLTEARTRTVGSFRSGYGELGSTLGSSSRSSLGDSASARAEKILEDIRRRATLPPGYGSLSERDRISSTRDILEQARQSGRLSKSQTLYGAKKSVLSEYLLKIFIGLVLFVCIYFVITSMTQPNTFQTIEQEVSEIVRETGDVETE